MPQSLSSVLIHLVFSTKNRQPLITPAIEQELFKYLAVELHNMGCPSLTINGTSDHIHILFTLSRTQSIANVVKSIKGSSSRSIKPRSAELRAFEWQAGYGAFSIGRSQVVQVKRYIARQKVHHRKISFQDEVRALLQKYEVKYDEKYVWD
ncbi:MAG: IS200/IS605 family transposase [Gemmatales bacterium]